MRLTPKLLTSFAHPGPRSLALTHKDSPVKGVLLKQDLPIIPLCIVGYKNNSKPTDHPELETSYDLLNLSKPKIRWKVKKGFYWSLKHLFQSEDARFLLPLTPGEFTPKAGRPSRLSYGQPQDSTQLRT